MTKIRIVTASLAAASVLGLVVRAQTPAASPFSSLTLRSIGPVNTSGRIDDFAVARIAGQPDAIYVATATGGVFKSANAGTSWTPVFDHTDAMLSIGAVAVSPSRPTTVWAGTGEANNRQSSSWGDGVYKSTDAGKTWTNVGLKDTHHIARIVTDPTNPDIAYVAAGGHLWGPNPERGVFKTTDGGTNWKKVLYVDENTGAGDLVMDPKDPKILLAAMYQRQRKEWGFIGGGPGSGIYRSTDAGVTWHPVTKGLPAGDKGRIGLDVFKGDGKFVEAIVEAESPAGEGRGRRGGGGGGANAAGAPVPPAASSPQPGAGPVLGGGLYRSLDGGESWEFLSAQNTRPSYYSQIRIDPKDRNRIYELGSNRGFYFSDDGGKTFTDRGVSGVHGEDHALWVDPDNSNHLIIGGDGGVSISNDRGLTWDFRMNMPIGQFYEIDVNDATPFTVCGGLQDNGEWCVPSMTRDRNGISAVDGWNIGGGDGFYVKFDPSDPDYAYAESQNGNMNRVNIRTMQGQSVKPGGRGGGNGAQPRWNWDTPIIVSSADPRVIYTGDEMLYRSSDRGTTWTAISPDLSDQIDPKTLQMMGRVEDGSLSAHDGSSPYGSMTTIGESPLDARVLYVGMDDGALQMTKDGGKTWTNITSRVAGLPAHTYVSSVQPSRYQAGRVYATFDGHFNDDYKAYVYVSDDFGQNWKSIASGLPTSVNRIREHPRSANVLIVAHERGVHVSNDGGQTWLPLSLVTNFPTVRTDDVAVQARDNALVLGTHGRSIWILDDMGPLEALTPDALKQDAVLAPIAPATEFMTHSPQAWFGTGTFFAPNPEAGAGINYYIREGASGQVQIEISDASYRVVRTLTGPAAKGLNRVRWDLRAEPPVADPNAPPAAARGGGAGRGGGRGGGQGPYVSPGTYQVTVKVPGIRDLKGTIKVGADPLAK